MSITWRDIDDDTRMELLARRYLNGESPARLAKYVGISNPITLNRRLQELRAEIEEDIDLTDWLPDVDEEEDEVGVATIEFPKEKPMPTNEDFYLALKKPISLTDLANKFDRSPDTIEKMLAAMEEEGYVIERASQKVSLDQRRPRIEYQPATTLADREGHVIKFAVVSDTHAGSTHAQPSNANQFIRMAYDEGVRHFFHPGDLTAGQFGYRGQEWDLVPAAKVPVRSRGYVAAQNQIWLADKYIPQLDGATYYVLGGNHDYWHINKAGVDAVGQFCKMRDDAVFLGYDVAEIPLTDRAAIRLWHPTGGIPYALSYRLQKGIESLLFDELARSAEFDEMPRVRVLIAGHLHVEVKFHRGPMVASCAGCFEGQTNYLKRKGLYPEIGGQIWEITLTDSGLIQRVSYDFIPFTEIIDDWKNWPVPPEFEQGPMESETTETLFNLHPEFVEEYEDE